MNSETVEQAADYAGDDRTPEQLLTRATLDANLQAALDALPEAFRQAVWLRDVEEFSYAEIAKIMDVPIGTVMSRISRGRRMLHDRSQPPSGRTGSRVAPAAAPSANARGALSKADRIVRTLEGFGFDVDRWVIVAIWNRC